MWIADAYAKINLGLNVLERLPTGYHRIESGFCFINWRDRFEIEPAESMELHLSDNTIPTDEHNLITQAMQVLDRYVGFNQAYHINVQKQIPAGAGLGGGSSNAALTLRMMNKIESLGLSDAELIDLSRDLGADVPFFIQGSTGIAHGVGHEITNVDIQPDHWIVTCFPGEPSSTAKAYQYCEPNPRPDFSVERVLSREPLEEWRYMLFNGLEQSVFPRLHVTGNLKDQFYEFGARYASMTGSGSAVYGIFDQDLVARHAYETLLDLELPVVLTPPSFRPDYGIYQNA